MAWDSAGLLSSPVSDTVLADTGALTAGALTVTLIIYAPGGGGVELQQRNPTNTTTVMAQKLNIYGGIPITGSIGPILFSLNERLRIVADGDLTGDVQVSVFH